MKKISVNRCKNLFGYFYNNRHSIFLIILLHDIIIIPFLFPYI